MLTLMDSELNKIYSLRNKGIQIYTLLEKYLSVPCRKDIHLSVFVAGKSGGLVGYKYSIDSRNPYQRYSESGHDPYCIYDVNYHLHKKILSEVVKESLRSEIIPDDELHTLLLEKGKDLEEYLPDIFLYHEEGRHIYTMKERK